MSHSRAETLFRKAGIPFEHEPDWIAKGRKPDFYCSGRSPFWCEVKDLERLEDSQRLSKSFNELSARTGNLDLTGQGFAYIHEDFSNRDAKNVVHLLKRALKRFTDCDAPDTVVALVPMNPHRKEFVRFAISTKTHGTVEFHSCTAPTGIYGSPDGIHAEPYEQKTTLRFSTEVEKSFIAGSVVAPGQNFLVAIVAQKRSEKFTLMTAARAGPIKRLRNPERIRDVLNDANGQFKNGLRYRKAPCLLAIFHEGLDVPDDTIIKSALYGDLKFSFSGDNLGDGKLIMDKDGAWNPDKNRTTSAVLYVRNDGAPLIVHNYWAERPFPRGLFACREVSAQADGKFREDDFANRPLSLKIFGQKLARVLVRLLRRCIK
ncbi:hypothetical protein ACQR16_30560 [Bradyrhizobium oligotrophicum]|uniref:hypothetical protein n=1 Tax=Bradyrhizobium oligotrophicum TaxID=44255 RepID=UPI003EBED7BE